MWTESGDQLGKVGSGWEAAFEHENCLSTDSGGMEAAGGRWKVLSVQTAVPKPLLIGIPPTWLPSQHIL